MDSTSECLNQSPSVLNLRLLNSSRFTDFDCRIVANSDAIILKIHLYKHLYKFEEIAIVYVFVLLDCAVCLC